MENELYSLDDVYFIQRLALRVTQNEEYNKAKFMPRIDICKLEPFCFGNPNTVVYSSFYDPRYFLMDKDDKDELLQNGYIEVDFERFKSLIMGMVYSDPTQDVKRIVSYQNGNRFKGVEIVQNLYTLRNLLGAIKEMGFKTTGDNANAYRKEIDQIVDVFVKYLYPIDVKRYITKQELLEKKGQLLYFHQNAELIFGGWQRKRD